MHHQEMVSRRVFSIMQNDSPTLRFNVRMLFASAIYQYAAVSLLAGLLLADWCIGTVLLSIFFATITLYYFIRAISAISRSRVHRFAVIDFATKWAFVSMVFLAFPHVMLMASLLQGECRSPALVAYLAAILTCTIPIARFVRAFLSRTA